MYAQLIRISVKPDKIDEFRDLYREYINPEIKNSRGYKGFYLLLNPGTGKGISFTVWETRSDAEASEEMNLYLEQRAGYPLYAAPPEREGFEVIFKA